ncbi:MAG: hypothetical protein PHO15_01585 [Eubacteriales bacterium]|nr:hypothetical protein [Eubacteriales bacterium]
MLYLLWSVHNGIVCGTGLYEIGIITSVVVTILVLVLDLMPLKKASYLLIVNASGITTEADIISIIKKYCRYHRIKSRNLSRDGLDMIVELRSQRGAQLMEAVLKVPGVTNVSLVAHDSESIV